MKIFKVGLITRIALLVVLVEVAAFSAFGWFYAEKSSHALMMRTQERLLLVGKMVADNELAISSLSREKLISDFVGAPYLEGMAIGGNGLVIVSTKPGYLGRPARDIPGFNSNWLSATEPDIRIVKGSDTLTAIMHIHSTADGSPLYYSVLTISTVGINLAKQSIMLWGMLGSLVFILLSSAGIVLIAQRVITRRVDASLGMLKSVESGDLDARIPAPADDELGQLQRGINSMTEKVGDLLNQHRFNAEEMRRQKDLLASIIQNAPLRVFWKDLDLHYVGCNDQFAHDAGLSSSDELIGKSDLDLSWREQAEQYREDDIAVIQSGTPKLDIEEPQTTPDGAIIWLSTSKVPLRDNKNEITGLLGIYTDITARKQAEDKIRQLAYFDPLTGLPNRRLLMDQLNQTMSASMRSHQYAALFMLDLDNFKDLNDSHGHDVGDELLLSVAKRLQSSLRQEDTVARLGGDEFVVIAMSLGDDEITAGKLAKKISDNIRTALSEPFLLKDGNFKHYSTSSIGVTLFQGKETAPDTLLKQADVAMYQAKSAGRNTERFFSTSMQTLIDERNRLAAGLRAGMLNGELSLYYQPQVDLQGRCFGAEALLRWFPEDAPPVSPGIFIPLAEETGLIIPIGAWVLEQACIQLQQWQQAPETRTISLAINVSAHQFRQPDFTEQVSRQIKKYGIDATRLKLELTESVVLANIDEVIERIQILKQLGVTFSLDDFGTGFSSLSYLKRLPLDQIKIDQSFVRDILQDPNDAAIVRAILAMSQSLGLSVIAEGVETPGQKTFLLEHGCENFQGYLFGKPMPIEEWMKAFSIGCFEV